MSRPPRLPRYRTGDPALDDKIVELLDATGVTHDRDLLFEMIATMVRLAGDGADRLDLKITNAALKEMRAAFRTFAPYRDIPKVTMFGSARTHPDDPLYCPGAEHGGGAGAARMDGGHRRRPGDHGRGHGGRRPRHVVRSDDPLAVRERAEPGHRRRSEARLDEVLLHPQADADQGVASVRVPAGRLRHPRRGLRAADARADREVDPCADRHARRPERHLLDALEEVHRRRARDTGARRRVRRRPLPGDRRRRRGLRRDRRLLRELRLDALRRRTTSSSASGTRPPPRTSRSSTRSSRTSCSAEGSR